MIFPADSVPLDQYDTQELITLRDRITKRLPDISSIDLQQELVLQFTVAKDLLTTAQDDDTTPLNQKSQIINTSASLLKQLSEVQIKLYSAERNKMLELTLIDLLKEADEEDRQNFMEEYERRLEGLVA